jgi:hypothetical protein
LLIARQEDHQPGFDYDTDWNQLLMSSQLKISTARSRSGPSFEIVTDPTPGNAVGCLG